VFVGGCARVELGSRDYFARLDQLSFFLAFFSCRCRRFFFVWLYFGRALLFLPLLGSPQSFAHSLLVFFLLLEELLLGQREPVDERRLHCFPEQVVQRFRRLVDAVLDSGFLALDVIVACRLVVPSSVLFSLFSRARPRSARPSR
jgi:hypothetical protein